MSTGDIVHATLLLLCCLLPIQARLLFHSMYVQMLQGKMPACGSLCCPQFCLIQPAFFLLTEPVQDWIIQAWQFYQDRKAIAYDRFLCFGKWQKENRKKRY